MKAKETNVLITTFYQDEEGETTVCKEVVIKQNERPETFWKLWNDVTQDWEIVKYKPF